MRHLYRSFCLLKSVTPLLGLIILATSCGKDPAVDPDTDGTVRIAKECTSGLKPVNIVITGDGFLENKAESLRKTALKNQSETDCKDTEEILISKSFC